MRIESWRLGLGSYDEEQVNDVLKRNRLLVTALDLLSARLDGKLAKLQHGWTSEDFVEARVLDALRTEMIGLITEEVD